MSEAKAMAKSALNFGNSIGGIISKSVEEPEIPELYISNTVRIKKDSELGKVITAGAEKIISKVFKIVPGTIEMAASGSDVVFGFKPEGYDGDCVLALSPSDHNEFINLMSDVFSNHFKFRISKLKMDWSKGETYNFTFVSLPLTPTDLIADRLRSMDKKETLAYGEAEAASSSGSY